MVAISLIVAICMSFCLSACDSCNGDTPAHTHAYVWTDNKDGTHKGHCDGEGCDNPDISEAHTFGEDGKCVCGAVKPNEPGEHVHAYTWTANEDGATHNGVCTAEGECDAKNITNEAHVYDNDTDATCNKCGYERDLGGDPEPGEHVHAYTYTPNADGATHNGVCTAEGECDAKNITDEAHVYDGDTDATCNKCGYERDLGGEPEPEPELITHAEYMSAAKGTKVKVTGVISGIAGTSLYFQDSDGGYYAYRLSALPEGLAVGKTIIAVGTVDNYNGLQQIKDVTAEVTDAEPATVAPKDITEIFKSATGMDDANLLNLQSTLVTIKGVNLDQVTDTKDRNFPFTVGGKTGILFINSTQCIDADAQTALKALIKANEGKTADITGFVSVYNTFQLVPAPADTVKIHLDAPEVSVNEDNGNAVWTVNPDASGYRYVITENGVDAEPVDLAVAEGDVTISVKMSDGQSIRVIALGSGVFIDSAESASVTYNQPAPGVPVLEMTATGYKWAPVDNASGYRVKITHADGTSITEETNDCAIVLTDKDVIQVQAKGEGKYKDGEFTAESTYTKPTEPENIALPSVTIAEDGTVTFFHAAAVGFKYTLNGTEATVDNNTEDHRVTLTEKLNDGDKLTVIALADPANDALLDSEATDELTYKPVGKATAPDANTVEVKDDTANVGYALITWGSVGEGAKYVVVIDGEDKAVDTNELSVEVKAYSSITVYTKGNGVTKPVNGGDYSVIVRDSDPVDVMEKFNAYFDTFKVKAEHAALDMPEKVLAETSKTITLPATGATYTDVKIVWKLAEDYGEVAKLSEDGYTLTLTPDAAGATNVKLIASLTCETATTPVEKEFTIEVKLLQTESETFTFSSSSTLSKVEGEVVYLTFDKGTANNAPVFNGGDFNNAGSVRIYGGGTLTVFGNGQKIVKIELTYMRDRDTNSVSANNGTYKPSGTGNGSATDPIIGTWEGVEDSVIFKVGGQSGHIRLKQVKVTYEAPEYTDADKAQKAIDALEDIAGKHNTDFTVEAFGKFDLPVSWSKEVTEGDGNIAFGATPENGRYTATVLRGQTSDTTVKVTAMITVGDTTKTRDFMVTIDKALSEGEVEIETHSLDLTNGFGGGYGAGVWNTSYIARNVYITDAWVLSGNGGTSDLGTIKFGAANKQGSNITDCPVFKSGLNGPTVEMNGHTIMAVTFTLKQWTTKTYNSIKIEYSVDGINWTASDNLHAGGTLGSAGATKDFSLEITAENIKYVRINIDAGTNQIGVSAISLTVKADA